MAHCSMFIESGGKIVQCVINRLDKVFFESIGFVNDISKKEKTTEIDPLTLHNKQEVDAVLAEAKHLKIPRYLQMKHETRVKKIKEAKGDN